MSRSIPPEPATLRVSEIDEGGERYVVFSWPLAPVAVKRVSLTAAERAVHALLIAGLSDAEIADIRGTTRSTVTKQVDAVFRKHEVRSRRELIARAVATDEHHSAGASQRA